MFLPTSLRGPAAVLFALLIVPLSGCAAVVQVANALGMNYEPAEYPGLKGKRVALVCITPESTYSPESDGERLAANLELYLEHKVKKIQFVPRSEVTRWLDVHSDDLIDYPRMGKSLKADMVLVVDLASLVYDENATYYQARADYRVAVYDVATGERPYAKSNPEMVYPKNNAFHSLEMKREKFKREFLAYLATEIGRRFHANEFPQRFSREPPIR